MSDPKLPDDTMRLEYLFDTEGLCREGSHGKFYVESRDQTRIITQGQSSYRDAIDAAIVADGFDTYYKPPQEGSMAEQPDAVSLGRREYLEQKLQLAAQDLLNHIGRDADIELPLTFGCSLYLSVVPQVLTVEDVKTPVIVPANANAGDMNKLYGENYGVDWVYAPAPVGSLCGCGNPNRYMTESGLACNKHGRCATYAELGVLLLKANMKTINLLALIHRDGGHHTLEVGVDQSLKDAEVILYKWRDAYEEKGEEVLSNFSHNCFTCRYEYAKENELPCSGCSVLGGSASTDDSNWEPKK